jgi:hypothetical protein
MFGAGLAARAMVADVAAATMDKPGRKIKYGPEDKTLYRGTK